MVMCSMVSHISAAVDDRDFEQIKANKEGDWGEFILELKGPKFTRNADDRGRIKLPSKYADKDVTVRVVEPLDEDLDQED